MTNTSSKTEKEVYGKQNSKSSSSISRSDIIIKRDEKVFVIEAKPVSSSSDQSMVSISEVKISPSGQRLVLASGIETTNLSEKLKKERKSIVRIRFKADDFEDVE